MMDYYRDEDSGSVFTDDSFSDQHHSTMIARSQDSLHYTGHNGHVPASVRMSTRSYSLGRSRVLSGHSENWSRGTIRPYSQDLTELQESFERDLYVNQRTLTDEVYNHKRKHKYEY